MVKRLDSTINDLELAKQCSKNGVEYWMARDIQEILGYGDWRNFENVIAKATMACESTNTNPQHHFVEATKMVEIGSGAKVEQKDYFLSRYACYLIAMNGDPRKLEIGTAQTYFAIQTRKQEIEDKKIADMQRIQLRERVRNANKNLNSAAKQSGVQNYALFHDAGYRGLYNMGLADIKNKKRLSQKDDLLDWAGRTELAANEFRITQTEGKLIREKINSQQQALDTHKNVGREVRATIQKLGGTLPEDLPPEDNVKKLIKRYEKEKPLLPASKDQVND